MRRWVPGTHQIPAIDDDGVVLSEWAVILIYLAKKAGQLIPADQAGEAKVMRWCFAAMNTVELPLLTLLLPGFVTKKDEPPAYPEFTDSWAKRRFADLDRWLERRTLIATEAFTAAAIVMAHALDEIKDPSLLERCGRAPSCRERCFVRPAWKRMLDSFFARVEAGPRRHRRTRP